MPLMCRTARLIAVTLLLSCGPAEPWANQVRTSGDVPRIGPGSAQIHLVDVGHGLAVLARTPGATLLYDGGTLDADEAGEDRFGHNRLLAWLFATVGPSGDAGCTPEGDGWESIDRPRQRIDLLVLSHPHQDHGLYLDEVATCFDVGEVWLPGSTSGVPFYPELLDALAARGVPWRAPRELSGLGDAPFEVLEPGDGLELPGIDVVVLAASPAASPEDPNDSSLVLRVELGQLSLLLTGDAGSGERDDPLAPLGGLERALVDGFFDEIDVDVLQVGHHGSQTSSRRAFLEAVSPDWALVSAGPAHDLPDDDVLEELLEHLPPEQLLRTDTDDDRWTAGDDCPDRIGRDDCDLPGGFDNWILQVGR